MKEIEYYDLDWRDDVAYEFDSKSPFTGIVVNYYTETEKKLKEKFITKNGEKDGSYESYHENGQLWEEGKFKEDKKEGLHIKYHENGQIYDQRNYLNGEPL